MLENLWIKSLSIRNYYGIMRPYKYGENIK